jgi:putative transposase
MSQTISPATNKAYGLKRVCEVWGIARSRIYREPQKQSAKRGPKPRFDEATLLEKIQKDLASSPFKGEGHRKVHARLKREGVVTGRNRILSVMKKNNLLSPHRVHYTPSNPHDGRIITDAPNVMWGSDGTKVLTIDEGWVWIFSVADHWNTECLGWHVCKKGDRFAAYEPISQAIKKIYGGSAKDIATGLKLRIDNGSQYTSDYFLDQVKYLGVEASFGLVRQPETNGVAERFHRTLKEQIFEGKTFKNSDEVREAVRRFVDVYNEQWLVAKRGYQSPSEARSKYKKLKGAA